MWELRLKCKGETVQRARERNILLKVKCASEQASAPKASLIFACRTSKFMFKSLFIELCFVCGGRLDVCAASFVYLFPASVEELTISLIVYFHALSKV